MRIGDTAPDFEAQTTEGPINFHRWLGDSWGVLFSHPKDFTPICTTELGYMAKMKPEFDKRNAKIIGLSADPVDRHSGWAADIKETQGTAPNYPIIGDPDHVAAQFARLHESGLRGIALSMVNYLHELPYFEAEVLGRLEKMGLRKKVAA